MNRNFILNLSLVISVLICILMIGVYINTQDELINLQQDIIKYQNDKIQKIEYKNYDVIINDIENIINYINENGTLNSSDVYFDGVDFEDTELIHHEYRISFNEEYDIYFDDLFDFDNNTYIIEFKNGIIPSPINGVYPLLIWDEFNCIGDMTTCAHWEYRLEN